MSERFRAPPPTDTFDANMVVWFDVAPSVNQHGVHFDRSSVLPSNSSSETSCHDPGAGGVSTPADVPADAAGVVAVAVLAGGWSAAATDEDIPIAVPTTAHATSAEMT